MTGMRPYTSYGTCALCGKRTTKAGMSRHLKSSLVEHEPSHGKAVRLFRLRIEDAYYLTSRLALPPGGGAAAVRFEDLRSAVGIA